MNAIQLLTSQYESVRALVAAIEDGDHVTVQNTLEHPVDPPPAPPPEPQALMDKIEDKLESKLAAGFGVLQRALRALQHQSSQPASSELAPLAAAEIPPEVARLRELGVALMTMLALERELFYPAVRDAFGDDPVVREGVEHHALLEFMMGRAMEGIDDRPTHMARLHVLRDLLDRHTQAHARDLFGRAELAIGVPGLETLGVTMTARLEALTAEGSALLAAIGRGTDPLPQLDDVGRVDVTKRAA